jgi:DNA ligase D-like protein (predicted 3'-phosphoesterase)
MKRELPIFVVHEHHTRRRHWDLRLQVDKVLKSWAIPKEPPTIPGVKRLALQVEDHEMSYADFEGEIAEGEYGAGTVKIWDKGRYKMLDNSDNSMKIEIYGNLLKGIYVLYRYPKAGQDAWLFFKTKAFPAKNNGKNG